jgi:hypothetical protein
MKAFKFGWATASFHHILPWFSLITFMAKLSYLGMSHTTGFRLAMLIALTGMFALPLFNGCLLDDDAGY